MKKILLFLVLSSQLGWSQNTGQNVVSVIAIVNHSVTQNIFTEVSGNLQNIGQTNHIGILTVSALSGGIGGYQVQASVQGSVDGTNYFDLGPITSGSTIATLSSPIVRFYGYGAFPYVRVKAIFNSAGPTTISFNIIYQGYSIAVNNLIDSYGTLTQMQSFFIDTLVTGSVTTLLLTPPDTLHSSALYGLGVFSDATGTTLNIGCGPLNLSTTALIYKVYNLGTARTILQPPNLRPIAQCPAGQYMSYSLAGTPAVSLSFQFRFE